jgi:hypothetical protein
MRIADSVCKTFLRTWDLYISETAVLRGFIDGCGVLNSAISMIPIILSKNSVHKRQFIREVDRTW